MQINSNSGISQQYLTALQNKQATTSSSFEDSLTKEQEETTTVGTTSSVSKVEEPQERLHEVFTYANTKGMTSDDIDIYFSEKTEEERTRIKQVVQIANDFSEDDAANEAVFNEVKNNVPKLGVKSLFTGSFYMEKSNYALGVPTLNNVIVASDEWIAAIQSGMSNPQEHGIFMNEAEKARYESGQTSFGNVKFTSEQADDFLSTMTQLAKDKMDQSRGTAVFNDYKEAYERYSRMNDNYNDLVEKK
jgi:hypothetical protein